MAGCLQNRSTHLQTLLFMAEFVINVTLFKQSPCTVAPEQKLTTPMISSTHEPSSMAVLAEQLRMSYRQLPPALIAGGVLAALCVWVFYGEVTSWVVFVWFAVQLLVSLIRFASLRPISTPRFTDENAQDYARNYLITAIMLGSVWGSLALLMPYVYIELRVFIYVALISLAGAALSTNAGHFFSYIGYVAPMLLVLTVQSFLLHEREWTYLGIITILFFVFISSAAYKLNVSLKDSITHRFSWQLLADELEETREGLNQELSERLHAELQLKKVMGELEGAVKHLEHLSTIDELTGLANRRSFDIALTREWSRARRNKGSIALLMIDVDRFKDFNDIYHHQLGDNALKKVAKVIGTFANRPGDMAARYGGEEFALILSNPSDAYLVEVSELLLNRIRDLKIEHSGSDVDKYLTVSIGSSMIMAPDYDDHSPLVSAADTALYQAKQSGRNKVCAA